MFVAGRNKNDKQCRGKEFFHDEIFCGLTIFFSGWG
jgi:hypothetical protein